MPVTAWISTNDTDAMTPEESIRRLQKTTNDLVTNYNGELMVNIGIEARKMIYDRVTTTGVNAKGSKFAPYSTKPMLSGCSGFVNKSSCSTLLSSKEKRRGFEWRKVGVGTAKMRSLFILPGGYKQWRQLQGRQTAYVDFSMTNRMWANINLISTSGDHRKGIAIIGARNEEEKKKLAGNTKRRGDILDLRMSEVEELMKTYNLGVLQVFRNNGL